MTNLDRAPVDLDALRFNEDGLIPVIAQDAENGEVLMMAWANREAMELTLAEGRMVYWSRSRQELWRKGDTSGHVQHWNQIRVDCDADVILARIHQEGAACHTGERSCFYRTMAYPESSLGAGPPRISSTSSSTDPGSVSDP